MVNMTYLDDEARYRPIHDKGSKCVCKRWLYAMHDQYMKYAHVGQGVLNTQPMNQTCS